VTVYVPHYAMSGGTLIALAADRIVMAPSAVLGPVDPQLGDLPVASMLVAEQRKDVNELDDRTLILVDVGRKAQQQVQAFVEGLLAPQLSAERARELARALSEGRWTHDFPIEVELARSLGLPVSTDLPDEVRLLMRLYPQPPWRRPSVEYVTGPTEGAPRRTPSRNGRARPASR
jgi:ClpP class serine protease